MKNIKNDITLLAAFDLDDDDDVEALLRHQLWNIYGTLLDDFPNQWFTAKQVTQRTAYDKKTINQALHRLVNCNALHRQGNDPIRAKQYRLNPDFFGQ